uniref:TetR/AcrR family transcriptional regulator n=1 Tax=Actinomadura fibrosa TaxID=111802 RepID=UPI0010418D0F
MNDTRERLLDAAERLYAERGIDGVSLREIVQAAGARNATAVQYHFGDRGGVIRAIFARHLPDVSARQAPQCSASRYEMATYPQSSSVGPNRWIMK